MTKRRTVAWLVAFAVGLTLIPAASAMASDASSARTTKQQRTDRKQNQRITRTIKAVALVGTRVAALTTTVGDQTKTLADLQTLTNGIDGRLKLIEGAAPQIIAGLGQLKDGLTTVGAGLTKLADAYGAVEYGVVRIFNTTDPNNITAIAPAVTTSDIPDDSNTAGASGSIPFIASGATKLHVTGAIRSAEIDGEATGDPAGQAGGIIYATCATPPTSGGNCGAVAAGQIGCQAGPPPSTPFTTPAGSINLLAVNIQQRSSRTGQTDPTPTSTDIVGGDCNIPTAGVWIVTLNAQFLDLPTSATPGPKD